MRRVFFTRACRQGSTRARLSALPSESEEDQIEVTRVAGLGAHVGETEPFEEVGVLAVALDVVGGVEARSVVIEVRVVIARPRPSGGAEELHLLACGGAEQVGAPGPEAPAGHRATDFVLLVRARQEAQDATHCAFVEPGGSPAAEHLEAVAPLPAAPGSGRTTPCRDC